MTDIVERLRKYQDMWWCGSSMSEAADEIERLRAALDQAIREAAQADSDIAALQAKIDALMAQLEKRVKRTKLLTEIKGPI